jgi:hypothetical protein
MDELIINYNGVSKNKKTVNIITGIYLAGFTLYFCVTEGIASRYGILFFCALTGFVLAAILILSNTLWVSGTALSIDGNTINPNLAGQTKSPIDWTSVSRVNIGISYIVFSLNGGQKQRKLDLGGLKYNDVKIVKSKIVEACEYKNIPYHND